MSGYLGRAKVAGLTWPLPPELDDEAALVRRLFPDQGQPKRSRPEPDWARVHVELRKKHVTKQLLWEEYDGPAGRLPVQPVLRAVRGLGGVGSLSRCARCTARARRCSSTSPAMASTSSTRDWRMPNGQAFRGRAGGHKPHLRRAGARRETWRAGLEGMCGPCEYFGGVPEIWSRTTSRAASPRRTATSRTSTPPTPSWRGITGLR